MSARSTSTLVRVLRDYLGALADSGRSPETIRRARGTFRAFVRSLARGGVREVAALAPEAVARWAEQLARRGLAPGTVVTEIEGVRSLTKWLHREGRTLADAGRALPRARVPHQVEVRVLGEEDVRQLYGAARGADPQLSTRAARSQKKRRVTPPARARRGGTGREPARGRRGRERRPRTVPCQSDLMLAGIEA